MLNFLKVSQNRSESLFNEDGTITLATFPRDYPNNVVIDKIKEQINELVTGKLKARLKKQVSAPISIEQTKVMNGMVITVCGDATSADWVAYIVDHHDCVRFVGIEMRVRALKEVELAPSFSLWVPDIEDDFAWRQE